MTTSEIGATGITLGSRFPWLAAGVGILAIAFVIPLIELTRFAFESQLYSYILLIPFISLYLVWQQRRQSIAWRPAVLPAAIPAIAGLAAVVAYLTMTPAATESTHDRLTVITLAFVLLVMGATVAAVGRDGLRHILFPLLFLLLMIPLPGRLEQPIESFLQHQSANTAYVLLQLFGTPVFRDGTNFLLPGILLEVAPECSGIRSTFVLVIVGILASRFLLRSGWSRTALVLAIVALGIFRNALRIFTIAQLCVHISPSMIDSPLHHRGGPVFFLIAMIPFFFLVWILRKLERRRKIQP